MLKMLQMMKRWKNLVKNHMFLHQNQVLQKTTSLLKVLKAKMLASKNNLKTATISLRTKMTTRKPKETKILSRTVIKTRFSRNIRKTVKCWEM